MAKVIVAGQEGAALVAAGKSTTEVYKDEKRPARVAAPPLEMKAGEGGAPPIVDSPEMREAKPEADPDAHIDPEDRDLSDIALKEVQDKARRKIGKYAARWQAELKAREKAAEELQESERFAENLFNEREQYRKKAEDAEARAKALEANVPRETEAKAPEPEDPKYKLANGEFDWRKFASENAAFEAKKAIAEDRKQQAEVQAKAAYEAETAKFKARIADAVKKNPDWQEVVTNSPILLQNEVLQFIQTSEYGTDISYFLAKNADVADKIKALHPIRAIAAIRDIEAGFEKPAAASKDAPAPSKTVERQGAPAPITQIPTSTAVVQQDPAKMTYKELREYERQRRTRR